MILQRALTCTHKALVCSKLVWEATENGKKSSALVLLVLVDLMCQLIIFFFSLTLRKLNRNQKTHQQNCGLFINRMNKTIEPGFGKNCEEHFFFFFLAQKILISVTRY